MRVCYRINSHILAGTGTLAVIPLGGWGGKGYAACCQVVNPPITYKLQKFPNAKGIETGNDARTFGPLYDKCELRSVHNVNLIGNKACTYMYVACRFYPHERNPR